MLSRTFAASPTVRQWMPARSPTCWYPGPPSCVTPLVVSRLTMPLRDAGPLHEATVCSQIEHIARLADTDTPEPLLVPRGTRVVSNGLHTCPVQAASAKLPEGRYDVSFSGPSAERPVARDVATA